MSIVPSSMKCPVCPDQTLETLSAVIGSFERCPNCQGLFISQEIIAAASQDRSKCLEALEEPKALLLPTDQWCPKCLQKLSHGRVRSRGVILTICSVCQALWTNGSNLHQFEESIERTLRLQIDMAADPLSAKKGATDGGAYPREAESSLEMNSDSGVGQFFRAFARLFDGVADRISGQGPRPSIKKVAKAGKLSKLEKPFKKSIEVEPSLSVGRATVPPAMRPEPQAPQIEVPEFIFPEETVNEKAPVPPPVVHPQESVSIPEPAAAPISPLKEEQKIEIVRFPEPAGPDSPALAAPVFPSIRDAEQVFEQKPLAQEMVKQEVPAAEFLQPSAEDLAPKALPKSVPTKAPVPKFVEKKPNPPAGEKPGFFTKLKSAWSPSPKKVTKLIKSIEPLIPSAGAPMSAPIPAPARNLTTPPASAPVSMPPPKPMPESLPTLIPVPKIPVLLPQSKPVSRGFFDFLKPKPRPKPVEKPVVKPLPLPPTPLKAPNSVPAPKPVAPKPAPVVRKPVAVPKPRIAKIPRESMDAMAVFPPWALSVAAVICSAFRDFGFEAGPAVLWGLMGWSIGWMVRLARIYPFKPFRESTLKELSDRAESPSARGVPVILRGQVVLADEGNPKGEVVFKQDEGILHLNRLGRWDILPRFFGLSNPRQLLKGEVTLTGWYRYGRLSPSFEVQEVRAEKVSRKSMVRSLRWVLSATVLVLAIVISLALE